MTALPDLNVTGAAVGQTFTVDFRQNIVSATLGQQYNADSDVLLIYNLSPCNFQVMLTATNRTFNLPAGVTSNPIPLSYRGTSDTGCKLTVKSLVVSGTPNTVSFDWFRPGEPILSAPATSQGLGTVNLSSISAASVTFPTPNNWVITQDISGNLTFTNTLIAGAEFFLDADANIHIPNSTIANVDGQATTGNYGVPLIVAQKLRQNVAVTTGVNIISFTTPSAAIYRVSGSISLSRSGGTASVTCNITYTDTETGAGATVPFGATNSSAGIFNTETLGAALSNNLGYALGSQTVDAASGTSFTVFFQDSAVGTNDFITMIVERIG